MFGTFQVNYYLRKLRIQTIINNFSFRKISAGEVCNNIFVGEIK